MPTTNPVPSQDPSDLLFNAGKLDEVLNGTGNSFTDRLGTARRTVAGMNSDFDVQLADAESDLNVYRADAAASAAQALGYLNTIRTTSYGAYASDPATDPLGNPPNVGDEYFNTTSNLLKRFNGTTWQSSDINTANLAAPSGSSLVGYDTGTVQDVLDGAKSLQDYAALSAYTGRASRIYITGLLVTAKPAGIAGVFQYAPTDTTSADNGGTIIVGTDGRRWKRDYSGYVHVKWFCAVGDGIADDTVAILAAVAYLKHIGGGTLFFDHGTYKVTDEILIDSASIRFAGTGRRKVYPGLFVPAVNTVSTIMPVHSKTAAVRFYSTAINTASTFFAEDINFATLETGSRPVCAFGFDGSGNFHRDYTMDRVGIHGFTSAFDTFGTGGDTSFGTIKIINSAINRNSYIARNLTGQWNGFVFEKNEAGQNLIGGLNIKAQAASITGNALEGQPNTVYVNGNYRAVTISGNYFELNSGDYVIRLRETLGAIVENNFWQNITATEPLSLVYDVGTTVNDRVIPSTLGSLDLRTCQSAITPVPLGSASAAFFADASHIKSMLTGFSELGGYQITPAGPHYAFPESAGNISTTSGTGLTSITKSGLSIASGNYIAVAFLISYQDEPALPPRFELSVNGTSVDGFTNPIFYSFNKANQPLKNKTVLFFGVVKATALCTSIGIRIYPHGLNPATGLVSYLGLPAIYDLGATIPGVSNVGAGVAAFVPETHVQRVSAAPIAGTWPIGYKLHARAPAAGGFEGWICTAAGAPGTWKTFGAVSA